ncbi:MAG: hypothetical protein RLZZ89_1094 [Cyanobacteriota bacterium]
MIKPALIKGSLLTAALLSISLSPAALNANTPQFLPTEARWCIAQGCIDLEIPKTYDQYVQGLRNRPALGPWRGMWFRFASAKIVAFNMYECESLDLVFIRNGKVVEVKENLPPCLKLPCPQVIPIEPVDEVIELQAGRAAALGIKAGSPAIPKLD